MIKIVTSGDYVQVRYVDTISEYVQEELKSDSDAIEYSRDSNGKIYLKFGRMTFEYADPTQFEIDGETVTDAADFITKLTALFSSSSPGGGGVQLEEYTNSAMSSVVMAYVFRDEDDNIFRVYEPVRNNDVSRKTFAYADSIDKFPFDNTGCYNNKWIDVKLIGIASDVVFHSNNFFGIVINGNSHTQFVFRNVFWKGDYGDNTPNGAEVYISGNHVLIEDCNVWYGSYMDSIGVDSSIYSNTLLNGVEIDGGGFQVSFSHSTFCEKAFLTFGGIGVVTNCFFGGGAGADIGEGVTLQNCSFSYGAYANVVTAITGTNIGLFSSIDSTNGSLTNCTIGDNTTYAPDSDQSGVKIGIGVQSVTGDLVDNDDPENPVVTAQSLDFKAGDFNSEGNGNHLEIDDANSRIKFKGLGGGFQLLLDSNLGRYLFGATTYSQYLDIDSSIRIIKLGDIDSVGFGSMIELDDSSVGIIKLTAPGGVQIPVQEFADNAAAVTGGLAEGTIYRTGDALKIVHA